MDSTDTEPFELHSVGPADAESSEPQSCACEAILPQALEHCLVLCLYGFACLF